MGLTSEQKLFINKLCNKSPEFDFSDCIIWPWNIDPNGYGRCATKINGTSRAHRACLISFTGINNENLLSCHLPVICHNRSCVNPYHLYWGTAIENSIDSVNDGTMLLGEDRHTSLLTDDAVVEIFLSEESNSFLSNKYNTCRSNIQSIKTKNTWKHLTSSLARPNKNLKPSKQIDSKDVIKIYESEETYEAIAERYNISVSSVQGIKNGSNRRDLTLGKKRGFSPKFKNQRRSPMPKEDVIDIFKSSKKDLQLSQIYDTSISTIRNIKAGRSYKSYTEGL